MYERAEGLKDIKEKANRWIDRIYEQIVTHADREKDRCMNEIKDKL